MAKLLNGILGGFSGKVGTVVGACWKGIDYMRALATSVTNPRTPAQLEQRAQFSLMIAFLRPLTAFLRIGFKSAALKMSAFNAAMAYNLKNAITGAYPLYDINYEKVLVSRGNHPGVLNPVAVSVVAGQIDLTWDDDSDQANILPDDQITIVVFNPTKNKAVTLVGGSTRDSGADSINLPLAFSGDQVQVYVSFSNAAESLISDSTWVGNILVA